MINNPIIHREVLGALRTRKAIIMQTLFFLAAALLIWRYWPAQGLQDIGGTQAQKILQVLSLGMLGVVAMFAPAFTAASLTGELERNTLESIFTSLLKPWEIALGKILGALAFLMLIVLSGGVVLCVPFLLGGISAGKVIAILGILLLTAAYLGMIGLLVSSMMHRSYRAIIVTYAALLAVLVVFALPAWPISNHLVSRAGVPTVLRAVLHVICSLSPLEAMLSLVVGEGAYTTGMAGAPPLWLTFVFSSFRRDPDRHRRLPVSPATTGRAPATAREASGRGTRREGHGAQRVVPDRPAQAQAHDLLVAESPADEGVPHAADAAGAVVAAGHRHRSDHVRAADVPGEHQRAGVRSGDHGRHVRGYFLGGRGADGRAGGPDRTGRSAAERSAATSRRASGTCSA